MKLADPSMALLAATGGDTVKLFDVSVESGDPCTLTYTPSPACIVNSVKWNHTNLVLASAGEDKRISLWRKNGQSMGTIPVTGTESGDNIEAVTSLCWQRSKPIIVDDRCTAEIALLGGTVEDSILMPDPLPSVTSSVSLSTSMYGPYNMARSGTSVESVSLAATV